VNSQTNPFQLKKHADDILEIIVSELITPAHKAFAVLQAMAQKFHFVIFTLEPSALLHPSLATLFSEIQLLGHLFIVSGNESQIPFPLHGIKTFCDTAAAKNRIRIERLIESIVKRITMLPDFRSSTNTILRMLLNPEVTFEQIEEVTNQDAQLVGRMLKIANSSLVSNRAQIEDLKTVVKFLGIEGIRQILIQETFNVLTRVFVNNRDKLSHMRRCSILSAHVGKLIGADHALIGKIKAAGLLHDIGILALSFHNSSEYVSVSRRVRNDRVMVCEAEKDKFGIDHQEIGTILGRQLSLPDYITRVAGNHHNNQAHNHDLISMSVMVANGFLNEQIEQTCFTEYEMFMPTLAEERSRNIKPLPSAKPSKPVETVDADEADAENAEEENHDIFSAPRVCALLKEELDNFILASPESQGL
jgi:HD-like signal output (HDOD) protein